MRANAIGVVTVLATLLWTASPASAQQRPNITEDPETVGSGRVLVEAGFDYEHDAKFPLSGLTGNLFSLPNLGFSIGVSSIVELQVDGGLYQSLSITKQVPAPFTPILDFEGDKTSSVRDLQVGAKVRFLSEAPGRPALGFRFSTRLPNASNESGLGRDTTDFSSSFLIGKTVQSVRLVGNAGLGILGDPTRGDRQGDVLQYGFSVARAVRQGVEIVGEINGRLQPQEDETAPPGTDSRAAVRVGGRFTHRTVRIDGGIILGMTSRDPSFGFTAGVTWVFRGFTVP